MGIPSDVLILRVNDSSMARKFLASFPINAALVSAKVRGFVDLPFKYGAQGRSGHFLDVMRTHAALTLDQCDNRFLASRRTIDAIPCFAADKGFVRLDELANTAERSGRTIGRHGFANAMSKKPSR